MIDLATTQRETLTVDEVAEILQRSRRAIYYWLRDGKLPVVYTPFGQRVPTQAVRQLARIVYSGMPSHADAVQPVAKRA